MQKLRVLCVLIFSFLTIFSCKNEKSVSTNLISKKKFISIMIEIHRTDALLNRQNLNDNIFVESDSLSYYNHIFKKYGVTRAQFYKTMANYIDDMKEFLEIQKIVMDSLKNQFALLDSLERKNIDKNDLWNLKRVWSLPDDGVTNSIPFKFVTNKQGNYILSAQIYSYNDDLSDNLYIELILNYSDSTKDMAKQNIRVRNNEWKYYSINLNSNETKELAFVEGSILGHSPKTTYMHVKVKDIMLVIQQEKDSTLNQDAITNQ